MCLPVYLCVGLYVSAWPGLLPVITAVMGLAVANNTAQWRLTTTHRRLTARRPPPRQRPALPTVTHQPSATDHRPAVHRPKPHRAGPGRTAPGRTAAAKSTFAQRFSRRTESIMASTKERYPRLFADGQLPRTNDDGDQ